MTTFRVPSRRYVKDAYIPSTARWGRFAGSCGMLLMLLREGAVSFHACNDHLPLRAMRSIIPHPEPLSTALTYQAASLKRGTANRSSYLRFRLSLFHSVPTIQYMTCNGAFCPYQTGVGRCNGIACFIKLASKETFRFCYGFHATLSLY